MRIGCDMDCIAVDLLGPWCDVWNKEHPEKPPVRVQDLEDIWTTHKQIGPEFPKIIHRPNFFRTLPPMRGAAEALSHWLALGHDVLFVTSAIELAASEKIAWMRAEMPFMENRMVLLQDKTPKSVVPVDLFIDDALHNLNEMKARHPRTKLATIIYPYNANLQKRDDIFIAGSYERSEHAWANLTDYVHYLQENP